MAPTLPVPTEPVSASPFPAGADTLLLRVHQQQPGLPLGLAEALLLEGPLDAETLAHSLRALVQRHPGLAGASAQEGAPLAREDVSGLTAQAQREAVHARLTEAAHRAAGGLEARLLRLAPERHVLVWAASQLRCDVPSLARLARELGALSGAAGGVPTAPPAAPFTPPSSPPALAEQEAFWRTLLAAAPVALDWPAPTGVSTQPPAPSLTRSRLPASVVERLQALARGWDATLEETLLAAFALLLGRTTRQEEVLVGVLGAPAHAGESAPGPHERLLPLPLSVPLEVPAAPHVQGVARVLREARRHLDVPVETLVGLPSELEGRPSRIQAVFDWRAAPAPVGVGTLTLRRLGTQRAGGWADLVLALEPSEEGGLECTWQTGSGRLPATEAAALSARFAVMVEALAAGTPGQVGNLPLLPDEERERVLATWSTSRRSPAPTCAMPALLEAQARRTPEALAVLHGERTLTYAALDAASERLARVLVARGVRRGERVAVCMSPAPEAVVALLGTLRAGAAYVPLDPEAPTERLATCLRQAGVGLVLTQSAHRAALAPLERPLLALDADWEATTGPLHEGALPQTGPEDLAYVIFTSGSTGEPKGVLIRHGSLINHSTAVAARFGLQPGDRMLQFTPLFFDAAGEELYPPLLSGATVVIRGELAPTGEFRALLEREKLSVLSLPPAYLHEWVAELERRGEDIPSGLRLVVLGGEKLLPETWQRWCRLGGGRVPWFNVYGPTESTITAALCEISPQGYGLQAPVLPIGRPLDNVEAYVLDAWLQPVPPGHPGELYLGGRGLAWGYLGQPELSAERFVPHPFSATAGGRLYRTGDVVRFLEDGQLEFLGRVDHQVKLRGFRIELGEVESQLRRVPGVQDALVTVHGQTSAERRLVAYVVPEQAPGPRARELREALARMLPGYMVPASYVFLERWPLTVNGKVDRKALPPPQPVRAEGGAGGGTLSALEEALQGIWSEVLGCAAPRPDDDFFELGGHSLAALQVLSRVSEQLGVDLELRQLFDFPTLGALAAEVERTRALAQGAASDVDALSPEQVEAMLQQLLNKPS